MQYTQDYDELLPPNSSNGVGNTFEIMMPYYKSTQILACPSSDDRNIGKLEHFPTIPLNYAINNIYYYDDNNRTFGDASSSTPLNLAAMNEPTTTIAIGDSQVFSDTNNGTCCAAQVVGPVTYTAGGSRPNSLGRISGSVTDQGQFAFRHKNGANFLFFDGHVKWLPIGETAKRATADNSFLYYFTRTTK